MKIEHYNTHKRFTFRQSWVNTWFNCPEQARFDAFEAEDGAVTDTDATAIGTAVHHHIEQRLWGVGALETNPHDVFDSLMAHPDARWVQIKTRPTAHQKINNCISYFENDIWPRLDPDQIDEVEVGFHLKFDTLPNGDEVWLSGTIDTIMNGVVVDWKTSRGYLALKKYNDLDARLEVQPTIYTWASMQMGYTRSVPAPFKYVVFDKDAKLESALEVDTERATEDWDKLRAQLASVVDMWYTYGEHNPWPLRSNHWLCSEKWCPKWATCPVGGQQ